ncbi:MAG: hypothetical protein ACI9DE_002103, partial [Halioglobus sp.]
SIDVVADTTPPDGPPTAATDTTLAQASATPKVRRNHFFELI